MSHGNKDAIAQAEEIYNVIKTRTFSQFYGHVGEDDNCPFSLHLMDDEPTKKDILQQIITLFNLPMNGAPMAHRWRKKETI